MSEHDAARRRARSGEAWGERLRAAREGREDRGEERLDLDPRSAYELLTRQMVAGLSEKLREKPSNDAENWPSCAVETANNTATHQLPSNRRQLHRSIRCQGVRMNHRRRRGGTGLTRRVLRLWTLVLAVAGVATLGAAARTLSSFADWLLRQFAS